MIETYDVAQCIMKLESDIAFDLPEDVIGINRFVIVDDYEITGGGIIQENLPNNSVTHIQNMYLWKIVFLNIKVKE